MKIIDISLYPGGDPNYKFRMMKQQWFANGQSGLYNDDIKWLFAEVERLNKDNEKLSNENSMSYEEIEKLHCCGNCLSWNSYGVCENPEWQEKIGGITTKRFECCRFWEGKTE